MGRRPVLKYPPILLAVYAQIVFHVVGTYLCVILCLGNRTSCEAILQRGRAIENFAFNLIHLEIYPLTTCSKRHRSQIYQARYLISKMK